MVSDAAATAVLTDHTLFQCIVRFQKGLPHDLFVFLRARLPVRGVSKYTDRKETTTLGLVTTAPQLIALHGGSTHLLEMARNLKGWFVFSAPPALVALHRKDLATLQWVVDKNCYLCDVRADVVDEVVKNHMTGDTRALEILDRDKTLFSGGLDRRVVGSRDVCALIRDVHLLRWLHTHFPDSTICPEDLLPPAIRDGNLEMVQYLFGHFPPATWELKPIYFPSHMPERWDALRYLVHHHPKSITGRKWRGDPAHAMTRLCVEFLRIIKEAGAYNKHVERAVRRAIAKDDWKVLYKFHESGLLTLETIQDDAAVAIGTVAMVEAAIVNHDVETLGNELAAKTELVFRVILTKFNGDTAMLESLCDQLASQLPADVLEKASLYELLNDVKLVTWLHSNLPHLKWSPSKLYYQAMRTGNVDLLVFRMEQFPDNCWHHYFLEKPRDDPRYWDCVRVLLQRYPGRLTISNEDAAALVSDADDRLLAMLLPVDPFKAAATTKTKEFLYFATKDVIERLESTGVLSVQHPTSVVPNSIEIVEYLLDHGLAIVTSGSIDLAAKFGVWNLVHYYTDKYPSVKCTTRTMDAAALQGNLAEIRYLHEHRTEGCSSAAMTQAVAYQHFDIIKYLQEQVNAPCSTDAMDRAAIDGRMDILRYLHEHRREGCTHLAMEGAAYRGKLEVVRFLRETCGVAITEKAIESSQYSARNVHLYLCEQREKESKEKEIETK